MVDREGGMIFSQSPISFPYISFIIYYFPISYFHFFLFLSLISYFLFINFFFLMSYFLFLIFSFLTFFLIFLFLVTDREGGMIFSQSLQFPFLIFPCPFFSRKEFAFSSICVSSSFTIYLRNLNFEHENVVHCA